MRLLDSKRGRLAALAALAAALLLAMGLVLAHVVKQRPYVAAAVQRTDTLAEAPPAPPVVLPTILAPETPDDARASNARLAIAAPPIAAPSFHFAGSEGDHAAARACLATAVLFEAGDDAPGEKAVAQVVLNRVRHPAFPKTVCGVIFQGSERKTGCQFTFTCDGSLARAPSAAGWTRAVKIAEAALTGTVDKAVGTATHYHADYVVPYWRSTLEKIAVVHTQIFYRWPGTWGSRGVLTARNQPGEATGARVAELAGLKIDGVAPVTGTVPPEARPALAVEGVAPSALAGNVLRMKDEDAGQFVLQLSPSAGAASFAAAAASLCGEKLECAVYGWTSAADLPSSLPVTPDMLRTLAFAYRKSRSLGLAQPYWDCRRFPRAAPGQCLTE